jgi:hypothetical protein
LGHIGELAITKSVMMMLLFAILMVAASISMIRSKSSIGNIQEEEQKFNYPMI